MGSSRGSGGGEDDAPWKEQEEDEENTLSPERRDQESWTWIETPKGGCLHWQDDRELQEEEEEFEEGMDCDARLERVLASIKVHFSSASPPAIHVQAVPQTRQLELTFSIVRRFQTPGSVVWPRTTRTRRGKQPASLSHGRTASTAPLSGYAASLVPDGFPPHAGTSLH